MIEFKQIVGRGTRTFEGKDFFTVFDFVKAYEHFNDPEWDGEPLPPDEPGPKRPPVVGPGPDDTGLTLTTGQTFSQAAKRFTDEYEVMTEGERNPVYVQGHYGRLRNHLLPFFGKMAAKDITAGVVQDYRIFRLKGDPDAKPPSRSTMLHEIVTLRHVLKTALRQGWIDHVPDVSAPFSGSKKVTHRAWFSPEEYKQLYTATRRNIGTAVSVYHKSLAEQLHDKILFMANTGIRPDEANPDYS
ncbi:MAG: hypothetical protein GY717_05885 [Rhodobacteraceae bacterium]|nr:hypothetical protein [Paracoccaceae bacterium]